MEDISIPDSLNIDLSMLNNNSQEDFLLPLTIPANMGKNDGLKSPYSVDFLLSPSTAGNESNVLSMFGIQMIDGQSAPLDVSNHGIFQSPISPPTFNVNNDDDQKVFIDSMNSNMNYYMPNSSPFDDGIRMNSFDVFPCTFPGCTKTFSKQYNLRSHLRIHYVPKNHECSKCDAKFRRSHDLRRHERSHNSIKPYACLKCKKGFTRQDALKRHHARFSSPCFMSAM